MKKTFTFIIICSLIFSIQNLHAVNQLSTPDNKIVPTKKMTWKEKIASKILKKKLNKTQIRSQDEESGMSPSAIFALAFLGLTVLIVLINPWLIIFTIPIAALFGLGALLQAGSNSIDE